MKSREPKAPRNHTQSEEAPRAWYRNEWVVVGGILLIGLVLRLWFLAQIVHAPDFEAPQQDPDVQDYYARALVTGDWTVREGVNDPHTRTTPFFRPPGHAYFLAAIYFFTNCSYLAPRIVNMALGLGAVVLVFLLGRAVYGRGVGLIAAFLVSTYWVFIFWEGELNDPIVFVFLLPLLLLVLRQWAKTMKARWAVLAGVCFGSYALMRPNILALGPVAAAWMLWMAYRRSPARGIRAWLSGFRRILPSWCMLLLMTVLTIMPVTIRNYAVSGEFVPISTYFGENFLIGNGPDSDGVTPWLPYLQDLEGTGQWSVWVYINVVRGVGRELGNPNITHAEVSRYFFRKAVDFIKTHKMRTLRLMLKKAVLFWTPIEITCNKIVYYEKEWYAPLKYMPGFALVLALFVGGMALFLIDLARRRVLASDTAAGVGATEMSLLIFAFILVYCATFLPFFVNGRARVPIIPFCLLIGAYGVYRVGQFAVAREYRKTAICVGAFAGLWALASVQYIPFEPDHARWYYQRANANLRLGEDAAALEEARHILDIPSAASYMNMRLGRAFADKGYTEEAFEHFMAALRNHPADPDVQFNGAAELIKLGKTEEGIAHYREVLKLSPNDARAHNNLGLLLADQQEYEEALGHFRAAIQSDPEFSLAYNNLGNLLGRLGQYEDAIAHFTQAIAQNPDEQDFHYNLAYNLAKAGRNDEAIERYRVALQLDPDDARAHNNLGLLLANRGLYEEAIAHYEEALRIVPDFVLVYANWANMLADQGKLDDGIAKYRQGIEINPDDAGLHNGLGFHYAQAGNVDKARHHYDEALRIAPDYPLAHNNLGNLLLGQGDAEQAVRHYRRAIEVDPRDRNAYFNLGNVYADQGNLDEAVACFLQAIQNDPQNADIPNNLANALVRQVRFDEAVQYYERALKINPDYANAHFNLGQVLHALGRFDEAIAHLSRVLDIAPDFSGAQAGLDKARAAKKAQQDQRGF